jgi:hypothetical protein
LIIDCPIIAQPHIAQKNQQVTFANHCQIASLFDFHLVFVSSSIKVSVIKLSVNQTIARTKLYGKIILSVSKKSFSIIGM